MRVFAHGGIAAVLAGATALRLFGVGFGLPALNDPDEPLFVMKAIDMLRAGTLDPGWFGHPATTLFYALATIIAAVGAAGLATGAWDGPDAFARAVFADPGLVVLPGRLLMVGCGVACVWLTWRIGRRAGSPRTGLIAAALLATTPLHVELSQTIRSDVPATVFMLLSTWFAVRVSEAGRLRDVALAGAMAGLAAATKWPAALVIANLLAVQLASGPRTPRALATGPLAALLALLMASPFLLIEHAAVVRDLAGEARPLHLGATGHGFVGNLGWYVAGPLATSFTFVGLGFIAAGLVIAARQRSRLAIAAFPVAIVFPLALAAQSLVWERWIVPALPFLALAAAVGLEEAARGLRRPHAATVIAGGLVLFPLVSTVARTRERLDDTRQHATAWLRAHVDPQRSVLIEEASFDLFARPGRIVFPLGSLGCVDLRAELASRPTYARVERARTGRAIVDLGHVDPDKIASCAADYAIVTHHDRYLAERRRFPAELDLYRRLIRSGEVVASFRPKPQVRGGPVVIILRLTHPPAHAPTTESDLLRRRS